MNTYFAQSTRAVLAVLLLGFGSLSAGTKSEENVKIRKGTVRVRITVVNKSNTAYTLSGWTDGSRSKKSKDKTIEPITVGAGETKKFHLSFGKLQLNKFNQLNPTLAQEVTIEAGKNKLKFINQVKQSDVSSYSYNGQLVQKEFLSGDDVLTQLACTVKKPANTAGELKLTLILSDPLEGSILTIHNG